MRTRTYRTALLSTLLLAGCTPRETMPELTDRVFAVAAAQYEQLEGRLTDETLPRSVASDGKFIPSNIRWWCSGFYPGSLWYIYEYTGDKTFRELAEKNTFKLYPLKQKGTDHDLGFQMNCSFGNAYRITGEQKYLEPIHTSARVLAGRFSPDGRHPQLGLRAQGPRLEIPGDHRQHDEPRTADVGRRPFGRQVAARHGRIAC